MAGMKGLLRFLRRPAGVALAAVLLGLHLPAIAAETGDARAAPSRQDCTTMPPASCADMAACAERLTVAAPAVKASQPAVQSAIPNPARVGARASAARMPVARIARYGPPPYLEFRTLLL